MNGPRLSALYRTIHDIAQRTRKDHALDLRGGARLAVRVDEDGQCTLTILRKGKAVGDLELVTFQRDCRIPAGALRWPADGQRTKKIGGDLWYFVAFRWIESADSGPEE